MTQAWSADVSGLSMVQGLNIAQTGAASVTVHGAGMGMARYTGRARGGQTGCEATDWVSETSMRCRASQGASGSRRGAVTVRTRDGSMSQGWSVDIVSMSLTRRGNRAGTGSAPMTVHGSGLGIVSYTGRAQIGRPGCGERV